MILTKKEKVSIIGAAACFIIFMLLLDVSLVFLVNLQFYLFDIPSGGISFEVIKTLISFLFLILGFCFLSVSGFYKDNYKIGLVALVILPFIILRFSFMQLFLFSAVLLASLFIVPLSNTYGQELKKWKYFRVGSNSVGKALFVFNIIIIVGIFLVISMNLAFYQEQFRNKLVSTFFSSLPENLPEEQVAANIPSIIDSVPLFKSISDLLPLFTALTAWGILEIIKQFGSLVAGIMSSILIRIYEKI